jgi:hypothetical protein
MVQGVGAFDTKGEGFSGLALNNFYGRPLFEKLL